MTWEEKKAEATKRMRALELDESTIREFELMDMPTISSHPDGWCGWPASEVLRHMYAIHRIIATMNIV